MPTNHSNTPQIIQRFNDVDTVIIKHKLSDNGNILASEDYAITHGIEDTREVLYVTGSNEDQHQHDILNIMDDRGNIFLECNRVKNTCMRNVLNINSPSGFKLGSVRNRLCRWKADYDIYSADSTKQFSLNCEDEATMLKIKITQEINDKIIATLLLSHKGNDHVAFTLTYLQDISILQKTLILSAVISYSEEKYNAYNSKRDIFSVLANKLCCPLFHEERELFFVLAFFSPIFVIAYLIGLIIFVLVFLPFFLWCGICFFIYYEFWHLAVRVFFCWPCEMCSISGYDN